LIESCWKVVVSPFVGVLWRISTDPPKWTTPNRWRMASARLMRNGKPVSSKLSGRRFLLQPVLLFAAGKRNGHLWKMNMGYGFKLWWASHPVHFCSHFPDANSTLVVESGSGRRLTQGQGTRLLAVHISLRMAQVDQGGPKVLAHGPCGPTVSNQPQFTLSFFKSSDWLMSTDPVPILLAPYCLTTSPVRTT